MAMRGTTGLGVVPRGLLLKVVVAYRPYLSLHSCCRIQEGLSEIFSCTSLTGCQHCTQSYPEHRIPQVNQMVALLHGWSLKNTIISRHFLFQFLLCSAFSWNLSPNMQLRIWLNILIHVYEFCLITMSIKLTIFTYYKAPDELKTGQVILVLISSNYPLRSCYVTSTNLHFQIWQLMASTKAVIFHLGLYAVINIESGQNIL